MQAARYVLPGDHVPDIHAQPKLLWRALGREETTTFLDYPAVHLPRETWLGEIDGVPARVQFRHALNAGEPLENREAALEIELALPTRGFRLAFYRSPDESLSPLPVDPAIVARPARRAEAVPIGVGKAVIEGEPEARLAELGPHIDALTIDDDKVLLVLRLWPTDANDLNDLLKLVQTLRARANEAIEAAAGEDGTLLAHPEVKAFRQRTRDGEAVTRRNTAIAAALLFGVPLFIALYAYFAR